MMRNFHARIGCKFLILFLLLAVVLGLPALSRAEQPAAPENAGVGESNETILIGENINWSGILSDVSHGIIPSVGMADNFNFWDFTTWGIKLSLNTHVTGNFTVDIKNSRSPDTPYKYEYVNKTYGFEHMMTLSVMLEASAAATYPVNMMGTFRDGFTFSLNWYFLSPPSLSDDK